MKSAMKIFCIFLTVISTVLWYFRSPQMKTRQIAERTHKCYVVGGSCKSECKAWQFVYNYCDIEPCYVVCEFQKPIVRFLTSPKATT
ncbi:beta-defensin 113 [Peromyscus maniculatus bairdii]|uniref:beta-defensin 113 n=1 Tax=Peromyscus maniculatus bairdii TaxID=230844 RepID=UPI003FD30F1D